MCVYKKNDGKVETELVLSFTITHHSSHAHRAAAYGWLHDLPVKCVKLGLSVDLSASLCLAEMHKFKCGPVRFAFPGLQLIITVIWKRGYEKANSDQVEYKYTGFPNRKYYNICYILYWNCNIHKKYNGGVAYYKAGTSADHIFLNKHAHSFPITFFSNIFRY